MKRHIYLLLMLPFLLMACPEKEDVEPAKEKAYVEKVEGPDTGTVGEPIHLDVYFVVRNSCGSFGSFTTTTNLSTTTVIVHPVYVGEFCLMYLPTRKVTYTFTPSGKGLHTFRFWQSQNTYVTKVINIK